MWDHGPGADGTAGMTMGANPEAAVHEALSLDRAGRVPEAIAAYERIVERWPVLADAWYNLALLRRRIGAVEPALAAYQQALARGISRPEEVHLNRAVIYSDYLRQDEAAERELKSALALNPAFIPALLNLGNLSEDLGRREDARALYRRILELDPRRFEALARLANVERDPAAAAQLAASLRAALADAAATPADRASVGFALGRVLDAARQYPPAFAVYSEANRASRASVPADVAHYDRGRQVALTDRLIAAPAPALVEIAGADSRPRPIFICGMYRSGSTLVEQLLSVHPEVATGGELEVLPRLVDRELAPFPESLASLLPARARELAGTYRREIARLFPGAPYVTDKRPENFLNIGLIKTLFPDAKVVHTVRSPLDNCLSIFFLHLDPRMAYALDLMDIGHYFREYRRLMAHWKSCFGADIFDLSYDALVEAPDRERARLASFLGLDPAATSERAPAARAVKTASVWQVREPIYRGSSGRARHYATELAQLRESLSDLLGD